MSYKKRAIAAALSAALMLTALTGCGSTASAAVSYTHLDVYKRQGQPGGSPCHDDQFLRRLCGLLHGLPVRGRQGLVPESHGRPEKRIMRRIA